MMNKVVSNKGKGVVVPGRPNWARPLASGTQFFRFSGQFRRLHNYLLTVMPHRKTVTMLSAGASIGKEAISALITYFQVVKELQEKTPGIAVPQLRIVAADINPANQRRFLANRFSICPKRCEGLLDWEEFFELREQPGEITGPIVNYKVSLKPEFQELIAYQIVDLSKPSQLRDLQQPRTESSFDVIFFNVVTIYMPDTAGRQAKNILQNELLKPGGLFLFRE